MSDPRPLPQPLARLFSLCGVLPLGVFLIAHLAINTSAAAGDVPFQSTVALVHSIPALPLLEAVFIFVPLGFHGGVGIWLAVTSRPLGSSSPYPPRWQTAMRITGVGAMLFILGHLPELRWRSLGLRLNGGELATILARDLSTTSHGIPWTGMLYLSGTACVVVHFCAGLWGFLMSIGSLHNRPAIRARAGWALAALGTFLWIAFANIVLLHATGAAPLGRRIERLDLPRHAPCPASSREPQGSL